MKFEKFKVLTGQGDVERNRENIQERESIEFFGLLLSFFSHVAEELRGGDED